MLQVGKKRPCNLPWSVVLCFRAARYLLKPDGSSLQTPGSIPGGNLPDLSCAGILSVSEGQQMPMVSLLVSVFKAICRGRHTWDVVGQASFGGGC